MRDINQSKLCEKLAAVSPQSGSPNSNSCQIDHTLTDGVLDILEPKAIYFDLGENRIIDPVTSIEIVTIARNLRDLFRQKAKFFPEKEDTCINEEIDLKDIAIATNTPVAEVKKQYDYMLHLMYGVGDPTTTEPLAIKAEHFSPEVYNETRKK